MLHLGNLRFAPADQGEGSAVEASPSSQEALRLAARFLHVEPQRLAEALVERQAAYLLTTYYLLLATYYLPLTTYYLHLLLLLLLLLLILLPAINLTTAAATTTSVISV